MEGNCAYCFKYRPLMKSHAIPRAAFKAMLAGKGNAIGIPYGDGNAHLTSDSGDAPLLCDLCEQQFNRDFDGPLTNALKSLENEILVNGFRGSITFDSDQLAHSIVSIAWRICQSPAHMYSEVNLSGIHRAELDRLMRLPSKRILQDCTVRIGRLSDGRPVGSGGFDQKLMNQFIKAPEAHSIRLKPHRKAKHFAMDWTMFGFLIHLVVPRLPYAKRKEFGGLKSKTTRIRAMPVDIFKYRPVVDALVAGYAAKEDGRLSPSLKKRETRKSKG
ncbi:hypothetical protein [uncultured Erythrobacter sp.]|uniref:hypothetical protein n=1 Tax=uncultured Erythrobacter sp. TaxID=263913 RepID=UPI00261178E7|nr:hypothetical protein [uncultured Erythrobacter sp.]